MADVKEKEEAKEIYETAKNEGHGAYLAQLDEYQRDVYRISIGNIPPGQKILVDVKYATELILESCNSMRLSVPVGLFERYESSSTSTGYVNSSGHGQSDHIEIPIHVEVELNMTTSISSVSSPSSTESFRMTFGQGNKGSAKINAVLTSSAGDFAVIVEMTENIKSMIYLEAEEVTATEEEEVVVVVSDETLISSTITQESVTPELLNVAINPS